MKDINDTNQSFENIKHIDENGIEFWYARELMPVLQYTKWQNFEKIIDKAKTTCKNRTPPRTASHARRRGCTHSRTSAPR